MMKINTLIVDEFFNEREAKDIREAVLSREFTTMHNPVDGVDYQNLCLPTDEETLLIEESLEEIFHTKKVTIKYKFYRIATWNEGSKFQVHTDISMGQYTLIVYLSNPWPGLYCGTTVLEHVTGLMPTAPQSDFQIAVHIRDANTPQMWKIAGLCEQKFNRGFILRSDLFHRAEPVGGYGANIEEGRLSLTCFFNLEDK